MKNKKLLCSVCFLFAFMSALWGQNITVKGNVTSKTDGKPIIGASVVQNDSKSTGTITDIGVIELKVVEDQRTRAVMNKFRAFVEEGAVILIRFDNKEGGTLRLSIQIHAE